MRTRVCIEKGRVCRVEGGIATEVTGEVTVGCTGIGFDVSVANGV